MDWGKLLQFFLNYFEKNPQLVENLLTVLISRVLENKDLQNNLIDMAIKKLSSPK